MSPVFWIIAAVLIVATGAIMAVSLLRTRRGADARSEHALAVYRSQLAELDAEQREGLLSGSEAIAARTEIERRMLAADSDRGGEGARHGSGVSDATRKILALILGLGAPAAAVGLYVALGHPGAAPTRPEASVAGVDSEHMELAGLVEKLAARLTENPDDLSGWLLLGRSYAELGDFGRSAEAYRKAANLPEARNAPIVQAEYAEALVAANNGLVTEEAREVFERVRQIMPAEPRARYYLALYQAQNGNLRRALDEWVALAKAAEPGASWLSVVHQRIDEVAARLGVDSAELLPGLAGPPAGSPPAMAMRQPPSARGPTAEDMAAAAEMTGEERTAMIKGMVAGLRDRLETETPEDVAGWSRLARAYGVLGRPEERLYALGRAAAAAPEELDVLGAYAEALAAAGEADPVSDRLAATLEKILDLDSSHPQALWFLGRRAVEEGRTDRALTLWQRLLATLEPGGFEYQSLKDNIDALEGG